MKILIFGVEVMNAKAQVKEKSCSRGTNSRLPFAVLMSVLPVPVGHALIADHEHYKPP